MLAAWDQRIAVRFNITGMSAADTADYASDLEDSERGVIICTAAVAAFQGQIGPAACAASKGGVCS